MKKVKILDTTLRDGSYAINFSFTKENTYFLCKHLEEAGIEFIEIGHGVGLNARNRGFGTTSQTDEEYMNAAKEALSHSKYGMFCIPGIALLENLDMASSYNMSFVRIGTDVTRVPESKDFIKRAKDLGLFVSANYMKSYALNAEKFAKQVLLSEKYGADIVYIVDSAGGMFPENIKEYFHEIRKVSQIPIGFHGHDNLGLSVSNTIFAAELGAEIVDSSLQGLGRSLGNAPTETLVLALLKKGFKIDADFLKLLEIGMEFVQPLVKNKGKNPLDIIAGYSDFHSSYMPKVLKYAYEYNVDPLKLIMEISKIDKVNINENELLRLAKLLPNSSFNVKSKYNSSLYTGGEQDRIF